MILLTILTRVVMGDGMFCVYIGYITGTATECLFTQHMHILLH